METLPEPFRAVAYIGVTDQRLHSEDIRAIYESDEHQAFKG